MISYSQESNAVYITLSGEEVKRTRVIDDDRIVDYDAEGEVVGVELLGASFGIDLTDLPERDRLESELRFLRLPA